jgi:protocatechuate 3,4-dioxygenase alpha subunit
MTAATASQTAGPYWHLIDFPEWADLTRANGPNAGIAGQRVELVGRITDGTGAPVVDGMVEIWQADPKGSYDEPFHGFGRAATNELGEFRFVTLKPGPVPGRGNATQAPHIMVSIFARGLMRQLVTRAYFAGEPLNETDPLLSAVDPARRGTLVATNTGGDVWRMDIVLQGAGETVFLEV